MTRTRFKIARLKTKNKFSRRLIKKSKQFNNKIKDYDNAKTEFRRKQIVRELNIIAKDLDRVKIKSDKI